MTKHIKRKVTFQDCDACGTDGYIVGVFHRMLCASCNGLGYLNADTGEAFPSDDVVEFLMIKMHRKDRQIEALQEQLASIPFDLKDKIYPPNSRHE